MGTVTLKWDRARAEQRLQELIDAGTDLKESFRNDLSVSDAWTGWSNWSDTTKNALENMFEKTGSFFNLSPASKFASSPFLTPYAFGLEAVDRKALEQLPHILQTEFGNKISYLKSLQESLSDYEQNFVHSKPMDNEKMVGNSIFIVHGRNESYLHDVERFIERCTDKSPIILGDSPNRGRDLLGKFEENVEKSLFAVIIMTGDDEGHLKTQTGELRPRARQNVVFELGYCVAKLGRDRVVVLYEPGVEMPSDFSGVVYIDINCDWKQQLAAELEAISIAVDLNAFRERR